MTVFERIKNLSDKRDVSVSKVAIDLGFSENLFYQWKNSSPKSDRLEAVADYFDVSVDYLLGRTNNPTRISGNGPQDQKSIAKQIMMRMNTNGLSQSEAESVEKEVERFLKWRLEEIKSEREENE